MLAYQPYCTEVAGDIVLLSEQLCSCFFLSCKVNFHMAIVISPRKEHAGTSEQKPFGQIALTLRLPD